MLSCFWFSNISSWPYLSLWTLCNSMQLPTNLPLLALTDRPHSRAAERRCLAHRERVEAVVGLWQANRMRKSKLLLRRHASCFALGTAQTDIVCNNTHASSGSLHRQWRWIPLDPIHSWIPPKLSSVHWWRPVQYTTWSRRCIFSAVEGTRTCTSCNFPKTPKIWNDSQDQPFQPWNSIFGIKYWITNIWTRVLVFAQAIGCVSNRRSSALAVESNQPDYIGTRVARTVCVNRNICMRCSIQNAFSEVWWVLFSDANLGGLKCEHCKVPLLIKLCKKWETLSYYEDLPLCLRWVCVLD